MDRSRVSESWIGHRVILFPLDEQGDSGRALHGWLRDVQDDGVVFAKGFTPIPLSSYQKTPSSILGIGSGSWNGTRIMIK